MVERKLTVVFLKGMKHFYKSRALVTYPALKDPHSGNRCLYKFGATNIQTIAGYTLLKKDRKNLTKIPF